MLLNSVTMVSRLIFSQIIVYLEDLVVYNQVLDITSYREAWLSLVPETNSHFVSSIVFGRVAVSSLTLILRRPTCPYSGNDPIEFYREQLSDVHLVLTQGP